MAHARKYPRTSLVVRLTDPEKLRLAMDEKRGKFFARLFDSLQRALAASLKV